LRFEKFYDRLGVLILNILTLSILPNRKLKDFSYYDGAEYYNRKEQQTGR
jgi:hypothetical protein